MKKSKPISETASIQKNTHCANCGWPVVIACCNDQFCDFKDAKQWDWWVYCTNKGCNNHEGQGVFQDCPDWAVTAENLTEDEDEVEEQRRDEKRGLYPCHDDPCN